MNTDIRGDAGFYLGKPRMHRIPGSSIARFRIIPPNMDRQIVSKDRPGLYFLIFHGKTYATIENSSDDALASVEWEARDIV